MSDKDFILDYVRNSPCAVVLLSSNNPETIINWFTWLVQEGFNVVNANTKEIYIVTDL